MTKTLITTALFAIAAVATTAQNPVVQTCYTGDPALMASVASALQGGKIEVHLDSLTGQQIALLEVPHTGGWEVWQTLKTSVAKVLLRLSK